LSRGSSPSGHPAEPLVSYQINRQLSGWIPPPLVIRAFGAHCQKETFDRADRRRLRLAEDQTRNAYSLSCEPQKRFT
jgi:hypothetical protein